MANSLGISYIAAVLNQNGHDAWLYNADAYFDDPSYKNLKGLFDGFHDYKQYFKNKDHEIWEEVTRKIIDFNPDWVGWTSYTANVSTIQILSEKLHNIAPEIRQVVGGPHSTMDNNLLLKLPYVDFAVKREGEYAMLELINDNDPKKIEQDLMQIVPKKQWFEFTYLMIEYGRKYSPARKVHLTDDPVILALR